jgi:ParB-like chromosome segregation protein Spo0J
MFSSNKKQKQPKSKMKDQQINPTRDNISTDDAPTLEKALKHLPNGRNFPKIGHSTQSEPAPASYPGSTSVNEAVPACAVQKCSVVELMATGELKINPESTRIYGATEMEGLRLSIKEQGIRIPLIVTRETREVLAGNTRLRIAKEIGMNEVPVILCEEPASEEAKTQIILESNIYRQKTREMKVQEYIEYKRIEIASRRKDKKPQGPVPNLEPAKSRDRAAQKVGESASSLDKGEAVVLAARKLRKQEKVEDADRLIDTLNNNGYDPARNLALAKGWIAEKESTRRQPKRAEPVIADTSDVAANGIIHSTAEPQREPDNVCETEEEICSLPTEERSVTPVTESEDLFGKQIGNLRAVRKFLEGSLVEQLTPAQRDVLGSEMGQIIRLASCKAIDVRVA